MGLRKSLQLSCQTFSAHPASSIAKAHWFRNSKSVFVGYLFFKPQSFKNSERVLAVQLPEARNLIHLKNLNRVVARHCADIVQTFGRKIFYHQNVLKSISCLLDALVICKVWRHYYPADQNGAVFGVFAKQCTHFII